MIHYLLLVYLEASLWALVQAINTLHTLWPALRRFVKWHDQNHCNVQNLCIEISSEKTLPST